MLKEELDKQLGCITSDSFYNLANERYLNGKWKNNYQFCEELTQDRLLMRALYERNCAIRALGEIGVRLHQINRTLNKNIQ